MMHWGAGQSYLYKTFVFSSILLFCMSYKLNWSSSLIFFKMRFFAMYSVDILCKVSLLFLTSAFSVSGNTPTCKAAPDTPSWPSRNQWDALNASISGQLIAPLPPGVVCDSSLSIFSNASCTFVATQWTVSDFHAKDPLSMDQPNWENDACPPRPGVHCDLQEYPRYVVNATKPVHVQAGINFARIHNVRLIVRGTGHDYLGR